MFLQGLLLLLEQQDLLIFLLHLGLQHREALEFFSQPDQGMILCGNQGQLLGHQARPTVPIFLPSHPENSGSQTLKP